jgi:hypothetical protein
MKLIKDRVCAILVFLGKGAGVLKIKYKISKIKYLSYNY